MVMDLVLCLVFLTVLRKSYISPKLLDTDWLYQLLMYVPLEL